MRKKANNITLSKKAKCDQTRASTQRHTTRPVTRAMAEEEHRIIEELSNAQMSVLESKISKIKQMLTELLNKGKELPRSESHDMQDGRSNHAGNHTMPKAHKHKGTEASLKARFTQELRGDDEEYVFPIPEPIFDKKEIVVVEDLS